MTIRPLKSDQPGMKRYAVALLVALPACASDVDLQLDRAGAGPDVSSSVGALSAARVLPGAGDSRVMAVAWHPDGLVVVGGNFDGTTDLGAGMVSTNTYGMGFVSAYDPRTGAPAWVIALEGDTSTDVSYHLTNSGVMDVAVAPDGMLYAVGSFGRTVDFGTGPVESTDGCHDGFIARYLADGTPQAPFVLPRAALYSIAVDSNGDVVVVGYEHDDACRSFDGELGRQGIVAKLDGAGQLLWKHSIGASANAHAVTISPAGEVLVEGGFGGQVSFGSLSADASYSHGEDAFLAGLTPAGEPRWLRTCARSTKNSSCVLVGGVSFTPDGRALAIGDVRGKAVLAGATVEAAGDDTFMHAFVAEIGELGDATLVATLEDTTGVSLAVNDTPFEAIIAGESSGTSAASWGPYLGILDDEYALVSARGMSTGEFSWGISFDVALGPSGAIAVAGSFHGDADFGAGPVRADTDEEDEGNDGFIAVYERNVVDSAP